MNQASIFSTILFILSSLMGCGYQTQGYISGATLSSVKVKPLSTNGNQPKWEKIDIKFVDESGKTPVSTSFFRDDLKYADGAELGVEVRYGTYKISLSYFDEDDRMVFQTCADSKNKKFLIDQPMFSLEQKICTVQASGVDVEDDDQDGGDDAPNEGEDDTSDVTISPVLETENDPTPDKGVNGEWQKCMKLSDYESIGEHFFIDLESKRIIWNRKRFSNSTCKKTAPDTAVLVSSYLGNIDSVVQESPTSVIRYTKQDGAVESVELVLDGKLMRSEMDCFYQSNGALKGCNDISKAYIRLN